jgi:hypothetical protein
MWVCDPPPINFCVRVAYFAITLGQCGEGAQARRALAPIGRHMTAPQTIPASAAFLQSESRTSPLNFRGLASSYEIMFPTLGAHGDAALPGLSSG